MSTKPLFTTLAVAFALLLGGANALQAQNPDLCQPDCYSSHFGSTQTIILTLPYGCVVRVKYAQRFACNKWYDLGIISIEELTSGCSGFSTQLLLDLVTEEMFKENPMNFPVPTGGSPSGDTCFTHWRVVKGGCWRRDSIDCDGDTVNVPCGDACCLGSYRICTSDSVIILVTPTGSYVVGDCDTLDPNCQPVCGQGESTIKSGDPDLGSLFHSHDHKLHDHARDPGEATLKEEETSLTPQQPGSLPQQAITEPTTKTYTLTRSRE